MITSGKSDERQIHSNKNMYLKIQMYKKMNIHFATAVQLACLGPNFFVFLILFKIYKTIIY